MGRMNGKVALVTGGASGLGKADCRLLHAEGAKVVIADLDVEGADALAEELGEGALALKLDVTSEDDWKAAIALTEERFGALHVLVNNAGIVVVADPEETSLADFRKVNAVMSEGVFLGVKYALPLLAKSGDASIINMSSTASELGYPPFFAYSAAKGAVRSMTKSIAKHCQAKGYKVRCNSVHPASIETPMVQGAMGRPGEEQEVPEGILEFGAIGAPEDVAKLVLYLASDDSRFVTGAELVIDNALCITPAG